MPFRSWDQAQGLPQSGGSGLSGEGRHIGTPCLAASHGDPPCSSTRNRPPVAFVLTVEEEQRLPVCSMCVCVYMCDMCVCVLRPGLSPVLVESWAYS